MSIFWRIIIAVVCVLLAFALIPRLANIFSLPISGDVEFVIRLCVGAIAFFYVIQGWQNPPWRRTG